MEEVLSDKEALHLSSRGEVKNVSQDNESREERVKLGFFDYISQKGYEDIVSLASFVLVPYLAGLFFVFIVVAGLNPVIFMYVLDVNASFATWAIGYEILAIPALFWIVKVLLVSYMEVREHNHLHHKLKIP
jgi:Flp pilus assembly protein TadB